MVTVTRPSTIRENWPSELEDRTNYGSWVAAGSQTMAQRVRAKVLDLLETHEPPELAADVDAELVRLVEDASVVASSAGG